jgi:threonylcarbamoyladenosine tRNA methylthiotransferase MtaB
MRVFLQTLGCRLNEAELERWSRDCRERGYTIATQAERADLVVVNTCAVTGESARKSRQLIRRARRDNPEAKLVVSGCLASLEPQRIAGELGIDLLITNPDKDRLIDIAAEQLDLPVMPEAATVPGENALLARGRHRAFIKVQDGCRYRCAFCIVTKARGRERSRAIGAVVDEVNRVHAQGVQEVVLAGVHLGGYGSDIDSNLGQLIRAVLAGTSIPRVRLGSLEPWELPEGFWELFTDSRLMPHLHLPIQSGSDSVLRRMSRRCRTAEFRELVATARHLVPDFNVTTDIIVGFPGETDAEWKQTLAFAQALHFGHIHIFAYSPRVGTKAAAMPDQLSRETKRERSRALHEIAQAGRRSVLERALEREFEVLIEDRADGVAWAGYTPHYLRVAVHARDQRELENRIVRVRADRVSDDAVGLIAALR